MAQTKPQATSQYQDINCKTEVYKIGTIVSGINLYKLNLQ